MKKINIIISAIALSSLLVLTGFAENNGDKSATTVAQFLKIGVGARAMGQAGSVVARVDDAYSLYWNPAGITRLAGPSLGAVHTEWFANISHQFFSFVLPVNASSAVGVHAIVLNMDPIEVTTIEEPHGTGEFYEASDLAIGVTYGMRLTNFFRLGLTGKYIHQEIYNESAGTFAFDIGSQLDVPLYGIKLGMSFTNFGGKMQLDGRDLIREYDLNPGNSLNDGVEARLKTEAWELPVNFGVGISMDLFGDRDELFQVPNSQLALSITGNHPADAAEYAAFGLEYGYRDAIFLRGGYRLNRDVEKLFYGAGVNVPLSGAAFSFDYALASFEDLDYIHIFSVRLSFK